MRLSEQPLGQALPSPPSLARLSGAPTPARGRSAIVSCLCEAAGQGGWGVRGLTPLPAIAAVIHLYLNRRLVLLDWVCVQSTIRCLIGWDVFIVAARGVHPDMARLLDAFVVTQYDIYTNVLTPLDNDKVFLPSKEIC